MGIFITTMLVALAAGGIGTLGYIVYTIHADQKAANKRDILQAETERLKAETEWVQSQERNRELFKELARLREMERQVLLLPVKKGDE